MASGFAPWEHRLSTALSRALDRLPRGAPISLLFSGGVDSGLLAWELRSHPDLTLRTVGLAGSPDLTVGRDAALELHLPWVGVSATESEVLSLLERVGPEVRDLSPTQRAVELAFNLAVESAPPGPVVCGQGADELFLGYAHFDGLTGSAALARSDRDLEELQDRVWPRTLRIAGETGREIVAPYLDPDFIAAAHAIPVAERLAGPLRKQALRSWAIRRGVPKSIALRPKRALQYGTGIDKLLRRKVPHHRAAS
ncbi:MAG: asparagine synthase C-terminal domain-containing protein [Thermoplasmata archaeon]|nr:asparagine synthase C-terminal domain-containing protein [Thermoplasmata archaeon]